MPLILKPFKNFNIGFGCQNRLYIVNLIKFRIWLIKKELKKLSIQGSNKINRLITVVGTAYYVL